MQFGEKELVNHLRSLKVESGNDWAIKDLDSFNYAHEKKLTRRVLRRLGFKDEGILVDGGCFVEVKRWTLEELEKFYTKHFTEFKDWNKRSPGTYRAFLQHDLSLRNEFKRKLGIKMPVKWSTKTEQEILLHIQENNYRIYSSIPRSLRTHLDKFANLPLKQKVVELLYKDGRNYTIKDCYHGPPMKKDEIINRIRSKGITSIGAAKDLDPDLYNRLSKGLSSEVLKALDELVNTGEWDLGALEIFKRTPEEYREIGDRLIKLYLSKNHRSASLRSLATKTARQMCSEGMYQYMSFYLLVNVLSSSSDSKLNAYYYLEQEKIEKFLKVFGIHNELECTSVLKEYLSKRGLLYLIQNPKNQHVGNKVTEFSEGQ